MPRYEKQVILVRILMYMIVDYGVVVSVPLVLFTGFIVATCTILKCIYWSEGNGMCHRKILRATFHWIVSQNTRTKIILAEAIFYISIPPPSPPKKVLELESHSFTHLWSLKIYRFFTGGGDIVFASHRLLLHLKCAFKPHRRKNTENKAPAKIRLRPLHYFCLLF